MYTPTHFSVESKEDLFAFMHENPFGIIVSTSGNMEPKATHLPFLIKKNTSGDILIQGHIAKANDHSELLKTGRRALAIFSGPQGYVSSSVYEKPDAPTWNYQAVHAYGTVRKMSQLELLQHIDELMSSHEKSQESPAQMKDIPETQQNHYLNLITGFELHIYKLEATYKLSQNRSEKDFHSIIERLEKDSGNKNLISEMKKHRKS
jgi:transcriptional regulator